MNILAILLLIGFSCAGVQSELTAKNELENISSSSPIESNSQQVHVRQKRTLFLKKKLIGAGLLGLGLGLAKGYKAGYHYSPDVHHVYIAPPPPVRYVEYVEKPVFIEKIVERPVEKPFVDYNHWSSHSEPLSFYGYP